MCKCGGEDGSQGSAVELGGFLVIALVRLFRKPSNERKERKSWSRGGGRSSRLMYIFFFYNHVSSAHDIHSFPPIVDLVYEQVFINGIFIQNGNIPPSLPLLPFWKLPQMKATAFFVGAGGGFEDDGIARRCRGEQ